MASNPCQAVQNGKAPRVIRISGSAEEMGEQHARLLAEEIKTAVDYTDKVLSLLGLTKDLALRLSHNMRPFIPSSHIAELQTIAETAKVPFEDLLIFNSLPDLSNHIERQVAQCTNVVVSGAATAGGALLHGRNLDFIHLNMIPNIAVVIVRKPSDGSMATISVTWAGFIGALTGTNARGLQLGEVSVLTKQSSLCGVPVGVLLRRALETCSGLSQVLDLISQSPRTSGFNVGVSSRTEHQGMAIEYTSSACAARHPRQGVLVVDDPCLCPTTARHRIGYMWGAFRHARMMQLVAEHKGFITKELLMTFLNDRFDAATWESCAANNRCICNPSTIQSVIFAPAENKMFIAQGGVPAPEGGYFELNFNELR